MKKVSVNLTDEEIAMLRAISQMRKITFAQALRHAVNTGGFVALEILGGATILIEREGHQREIVFQVTR